MSLGVWTDDAGNEVLHRYPDEQGVWSFDEDDYLLYALLCDPIECAELLGEDPSNHAYGGTYEVRDYQYPLFRMGDQHVGSPYAGAACARSVGKTESIKWRSVSHAFRRVRQNLLLTAPELIHLLPLTDSIEDKIRSTRLTREFLDYRGGKTGFTHRPFGVDFADGTKIVGRIPRITGTGVKGQHQPDLIVDEAQDYPEKGWIEVHEAQPLDAPILTPTGYRAMGDLRAGDYVLGVTGRPVEILDVLDHGERDVLRMVFDDGAAVECDADHWWTVAHTHERWRVVRASEIEAHVDRGYAVPQPGVAIFAEPPPLACDPYLLGVALGDGCMRKGAFELSVGDPELLEHVGARLDPGEEFVHASGYDYRLRKRPPRSRHGRPALRDALEAVGVWGSLSHEKFIPADYLTASVHERLELLAGLVDTDGNVDRQGAVRFCTSSDELARGVEFIVRSLGGALRRSTQVDKRGYRTMHVVRFRLPGMVPCKLSRKAARVRPMTGSMPRKIVRVERVGRKPMRCIEVDAPDGLYLANEFIPTHNTVMKDTVDRYGNPDFFYHFYGVHSGVRDSGFSKRAAEGAFSIVNVTALQRPGWNASEKAAAKAAYGGTQASDYRRNIYGEPGSASSPFFVTARLMACLDQNRESVYNLNEYVHQDVRVEDFDEMDMLISELLDLPSGFKNIWGGMDVGLTESPTVITLFTEQKIGGVRRLKLLRRITLNRMRTRTIREALYAIGWHFGADLKGFGMDITGLGFPIWQEMEDDEACPPHFMDVSHGYFFNAKVPVGVDKELVTEDASGRMRDHLGAAVTEEHDPLTGITRFVTHMPMIEASTRYLREMVDQTFLLLPFDTEITGDMLGETTQRVRRIAGLKSKPNAFHILDSMRAMAMAYKSGDIAEALQQDSQVAVLDVAL